jgi:undecaprenyl diphosphate synthase
VAIIMDGNGRWATARGLPRLAGHRAGADAMRRAVRGAVDLGVRVLTLYAFSTDNWRRPTAEVRGLMRLFHEHLTAETDACRRCGVRLSVIGRRDRLGPLLRAAISSAEMATAGGAALELRLAIDYSGRDAILAAASARAHEGEVWSRERFAGRLGLATGQSGPSPDVDLLIRTGGEQRLSDFLLWECAYAELHFTPRLWPDFEEADLEAAVTDFQRRERRFGGLARAAAG